MEGQPSIPQSHKEQTVFKRIEKKYLITELQYQQIIGTIKDHTNPDRHKEHDIFSLYFDTPNHLLIRRSIDKPVYKEKLRLRCYGVPHDESPVFVEIKKKYKKVVYKRRAEMSFKDARTFLSTGIIPDGYEAQKQILNEIAWFLRLYNNPVPSMLIAYQRTAHYGKENKSLRITFDNNIVWKDIVHRDVVRHDGDFSPVADVSGTRLLDEGLMIMEIKIPGAMPLWLTELLSSTKIYPTSFSKYGTAYKKNYQKEI